MTSRLQLVELDLPPEESLCVGVIDRISDDGIPYIRIEGRRSSVAARSLVQVPKEVDASKLIHREVLVRIVAGSGMPIIVGFLQDTIWETGSSTFAKNLEAGVYHITADREISLQCGKSKIMLRKDGTILLKGINVTSRASRSQKLRGATININ